MSQGNVEIVRQIFEVFRTGGIDAVLRFCSPDVVWYPIAEWLEDDVYRGHDDVRRLVTWVEEFDEPAWEIHEIREVRDRVLARADLTGRVRGSGIPIRQPFAAIFSDFRDDMIGEIRFYRGEHEALKAVGLAE